MPTMYDHTYRTAVDGESDADSQVAGPPPKAAWTRTRGPELVVEYVASHHAETSDGVGHDRAVTHLLLDHGRDPEKADLAIQWALADGLIHEPDASN